MIDPSEGSGQRTGAPGLYAVDADGKDLKQRVHRLNKPFITDGSFDDKLLSPLRHGLDGHG